jgi:hypothetical protein
MKGKTIAKISELMLPLVMKGHGPQYALSMMDAEALLDTHDGTLSLPVLRAQTARAIAWVEEHCAGPVKGSLVESKAVPAHDAVYPLRSINNAENASLWPTAAYLLALVGMKDAATYEARARGVADWLCSMQDDDGGFWTHQDATGRRFGEKYGNINFYGSVALWYFNAVYERGVEPARAEGRPDVSSASPAALVGDDAVLAADGADLVSALAAPHLRLPRLPALRALALALVRGDARGERGEGVADVLVLAALALALGGDARRHVKRARAALGLVAVLAARPRASIGLDAHVAHVEGGIDALALDKRRHRHRRRVDAATLLVGRDALPAVTAGLACEQLLHASPFETQDDEAGALFQHGDVKAPSAPRASRRWTSAR